MNKTLEKLRVKWKEMLIGKETDTQLEEVKRLIEEIGEKSLTLLNTINRKSDVNYLWEEVSNFKISQVQTDNYTRLEMLAKAYHLKGTVLYKNKEVVKVIRYGLEFLYNTCYNTSFDPYYGNWWNWEIGTPLRLNNIICLMWDELTKKERDTYCEVIYFYQPDPRHSGLRTFNDAVRNRISLGGNRLDTVKIAILLGINTENIELIHLAQQAIVAPFEKVKAKDGLYEDGSFIQHCDVPYTGTYGNVLLGGLGEMCYLLQDTPFAIKNSEIENSYEMIFKSFVPVIYKGNCLEIVNGRGASRQEWQNNRIGHAIINSMLWFTAFAPEHYKERLERVIKYWISEDDLRDYIRCNNNINMIKMAKAIMQDPNIIAQKPIIGYFSYNQMDRAVHHTEHFTFALSMHSRRIRTYEVMNGENKKGYHTSDGMFYIYNGDLKEYNQDYYCTVNPKRLAGITVDVKPLKDGEGYFRSSSTWVSTMDYKNIYGIAGMQLDKHKWDECTGEIFEEMDMDLRAKKSYFMLESEVVFLGADITSSKNRKIETIIDTRKIRQSLDNEIVVDGKKIDFYEHQVLLQPEYIYVEGNKKDLSTGYYMLQKKEVILDRELRKGCWKEVNEGGSEDIKQNAYATLSINHGTMPTEESYAYIIVPNVQKVSLIDYAAKKQIKILENNKHIQAIRYGNKIMANIWDEQGASLQGITISEMASFVMEETENQITFKVCDPTKVSRKKMQIILDRVCKRVIQKSVEVESIVCQQQTMISINMEESNGYGIEIILEK